ncbi:hypothetical protein Efla_004372 [Eimeria flavescens]
MRKVGNDLLLIEGRNPGAFYEYLLLLSRPRLGMLRGVALLLWGPLPDADLCSSAVRGPQDKQIFYADEFMKYNSRYARTSRRSAPNTSTLSLKWVYSDAAADSTAMRRPSPAVERLLIFRT